MSEVVGREVAGREVVGRYWSRRSAAIRGLGSGAGAKDSKRRLMDLTLDDDSAAVGFPIPTSWTFLPAGTGRAGEAGGRRLVSRLQAWSWSWAWAWAGS